jgi:hypothetical protein
MEHFTVDQTCKHGGCETAIMFVISRDSLAKPAPPAGIYKHSGVPNTPTQTMYDDLFLLRLNLPTSLDTLQYVLTVLVQLQLRDDDLGRVNADRY